jgi:hypothetical protein
MLLNSKKERIRTLTAADEEDENSSEHHSDDELVELGFQNLRVESSGGD